MKNGMFTGRSLPLRSPGFSGVAAVLDHGRGARTAVLISGAFGSGKSAVVLDQKFGIWELSMPSASGRVRFRPQLRMLGLEKAGRTEWIGFDQSSRIHALGARLRSDRAYRERSLEFFAAAGRAMIRAEKQSGISLPLLDDPGHGKRSKQEDRTLRGLILEIDDKGKKDGDDPRDRPKGGWVGVDVPCFIACMRECEEDVSWYEVWMHVYCLARCAIHCGTGGSPL